MKVLVTTLLVSIISFNTANAQFWKKLEDKVSKRVENAVTETISRKAAQKASQSVDRQMEKVFNIKVNKNSEPVDPKKLPNSYSFNWKYALKMESNQLKSNEDVKMIYHLRDDSKYFGMTMDLGNKASESFVGNTLTVYDFNNALIASLITTDKGKVGQLTSIDTSAYEDDVDNNDIMKDFTFKELGNKKILGYNCKGFQAENDQYKIISYVLFDAPVGFDFSDQKNGGLGTLPEGLDAKWMAQKGKALTMQMQFENKKKKKESMTVTCVALEKFSLSVDPSQYQFVNSSFKN